MGRIIRIATMAEDVPQAIDLGMTTPGKLLIKNQGGSDIIMGYDRSQVLAATAVNYMTLDAGTMLIFDSAPGVGFLNQNQLMWFNSPIGTSTLEIWVATQ